MFSRLLQRVARPAAAWSATFYGRHASTVPLGEALRAAAREMRFDAVGISCNNIDRSWSADEFEAELREALLLWRKDGVMSVWLQVSPERADLVSTAVQTGFELHRTQNGHIHLLNWLSPGPCRVPPYATHQLGLGGVVLNSRGEVLAIREKHAVVEGFKLPGGLSDPGEDFSSAVEREVWEETGVRARFESVLAMRHQHNVGFSVSDLYVICRCVALSDTISPCNDEIAEARWLPLEELAQSTNQMVALALRSLQRSLDERAGDTVNAATGAASTGSATAHDESHPNPAYFAPVTMDARIAGDNCLAGQTELLPCDMAQATVPSVVHAGRTFKLYLPSSAQHLPLGSQHYRQVKRLPNSDKHIM